MPLELRRRAEPWLGPLFPVAGRSRCPTTLLLCGYATGFVVMAVAAVLRQPGVAATQTLWAEDGVIFYAQALSKPFLRSLVTAYNGYDQLVPRLVIQLARAFPVRDVPTVVALAGAMSLAAIGGLVFHMARGHIPSASLRALLVGAMVLLPVANFEMLDNLVNLPWWMFFAVFWALLWRPCNRGGAIVAALLCALAAASEPLIGLLLPLAGARVMVTRRLWDQSAVIGLAAGLVVQLVVVVGAKSGHSFPAAGLAGVPGAFAIRVGLSWLTGRRGTAALLHWDRPVTEALGALLFVVVVGAGLKLGSRRGRALTVAAAALAPLCFAVPVWLRGAAPVMATGWTATSIGFAGRYAATPVLMLLSAVLALAGHLSSTGPRDSSGAQVRCGRTFGSPDSRRRPGYRPAWVAAVVCAFLLPAWVVDFRDVNSRMDGPTWRSQLVVASAQCRRWNSDGLARVAVTPRGDSFVIHCRVLGHRGVWPGVLIPVQGPPRHVRRR